MAKYAAAEAGIEAVDAALQAHGGSGFTEDTGLYEMYPLVRLLRTAPVNRELCLSYIGEKVMLMGCMRVWSRALFAGYYF